VIKVGKSEGECDEADKFRAMAAALLELRHNDWNDREYNWLCDEIHRTSDYIYTETERAVLDRLGSCARSFTEYAGYSVPELIAIAYPYRAYLDEDGQEFVERLHAWGATELKRRQIRRLADICRQFEGIERDMLDEAA
jgi:hypothetical protein